MSIFFFSKYSFEINHWGWWGSRKVIWDEEEQNKLDSEEGAVGSSSLCQVQQKARGTLANISPQPPPGQADTLTPPQGIIPITSPFTPEVHGLALSAKSNYL